MRHRLRRTINAPSVRRLSVLRNMSISIIKNGRIRTTLARAKALRPFIEKLVTKSANNSLASRRLLISRLRHIPSVDKLMTDFGPKYSSKPGGYTRILKNGYRNGDNSPMALIEFV